jgi:hypothetical protein
VHKSGLFSSSFIFLLYGEEERGEGERGKRGKRERGEGVEKGEREKRYYLCPRISILRNG